MSRATFRFNLFLRGEEPDIDDVGCMDDLRQSLIEQLVDAQNRTEVALALLVSCCYFELDSMPAFRAGFYHCVGAVRCRGNSESTVDALFQIVFGPFHTTNGAI